MERHRAPLDASPALLTLFLSCALAGAGMPGPATAEPARAALYACANPTVPAEGAVLDNGCLDRSDGVTWSFRWEGCYGAAAYEVLVQRAGATSPAVDATTPALSYQYSCSDCSFTATDGWFWRVRASVNGAWSDWSPERSFRLEPVDTDCPTGPLSVACAPDGEAQVGVEFRSSLEAQGGSPPYGFAVDGDLPPGLALDAATGEIAGVPTTPGMFAFTARATDAAGREAASPCHITVARANGSPDCSLAQASKSVLWPPDRLYHEVSVTGVTDPDGDPVAITVTGVTQDEPPDAAGDGTRCADARLAGAWPSLRAERTASRGNGRVYGIHFTAADGQGGQCSGTVTVCVPHDLGDRTCVDDGQRFSSLGDCPAAAAAMSLRAVVANRAAATIEFSLPSPSPVLLSVHDLAGRRVATLENAALPAGTHERSWNLGDVPSGMYFVRLRAGALVRTATVLRTR